MAIHFLQISDMHLGSSLSNLPDDIAAPLQQAARDVFAEALQQAKNNGVELVLLPGDLFEHDGSNPAAELRFIYEQAARLAPVPVVIAPGNHDPYGEDSPYTTEQTPDNVLLFRAGDFTTMETPHCIVAGRAAQPGDNSLSLEWSGLPRPPVGKASVLLLHAAVVGVHDVRVCRGRAVGAALGNIANSGYSYTALGHYHTYRMWQRDGVSPAYAAYAGCPQSLGWDELGPKGYVTGAISERGAEVEFVPVARHTWHKAVIELPPSYQQDAETRLLNMLQDVYDELGEGDLLKLTLRGRWPKDGRTALLEKAEQLCRRAWHSPGVNLAGVDFFAPLPRRGDGDVVDKFLDQCERGMESEDAADASASELARYLGLRLLGGQGLPTEVA